MIATPRDIVGFWREAGPDAWFKKDAAFDTAIATRFLHTYAAAARGGLSAWENTIEGALALVIALDQFPRNMFRGSPRAFATDALAHAIAERAIAKGFDLATPVPPRLFFYLPGEHAEDLAAQEAAVARIAAMGDAEYTKYAIVHRDLVARFGRFPHRNVILGRASTPDEIAYLAGDGFKG